MPKINVENIIADSLREKVVILIFWAKGCPFSIAARDHCLVLRKRGLKVSIRCVGSINDREVLSDTASLINSALLKNKQQTVTWPQVLYRRGNSRKFTRMKGGSEELIKTNFGV